MKMFVGICLLVAAIGAPLILFGPKEHKNLIVMVLLAAAVIGQFGAIFFMRKRSTGEAPQIKSSNKQSDDEYHNDFSKVGSGSAEAPKPIDQTGNVFESARNSFNQELENLEDKIKR